MEIRRPGNVVSFIRCTSDFVIIVVIITSYYRM
jgi:hypothetical protein